MAGLYELSGKMLFENGRWVPVFPLPNLVLMPSVIVPLHVFEQRYRLMTRDALADDRLLAVALLRSGFEATYHTLEAPIHPIVCIGRILREERLTDGRYNILLQGFGRARVVDENRDLGYRRARLRLIPPTSIDTQEESRMRRRIHQLLASTSLFAVAQKAKWLDLLNCQDLDLSDLLDVLSAAAFPDLSTKQAFLEEADVSVRFKTLLAALECLSNTGAPPTSYFPPQQGWPPPICPN